MAGVSTAAPYKHFEDRDDMMRHIVLQGMSRLYAGMVHAVETNPSGSNERIAALGRAYVDFARQEPGVFRMMFSLAKAHEEDETLRAAGDQANGLVERVVSEHLDIPLDSPETALRAYALWCCVHGHCFLMLDGKVEPQLTTEQEAALLSLVGSAILPPR